MDLGNLIFSVVFMGGLALVATGWLFRGIIKPEARWRWFFIIWVVGIIVLLIATNL